jgi:hypothetical protein
MISADPEAAADVMPNIDNSPLWAIELRIAELEDRIRMLEADASADADTLRKVARLRFERNAEIQRRDLCMMTLLGGDYVYTKSFTERWRQATSSRDPMDATPTFEELRRRRRA